MDGDRTKPIHHRDTCNELLIPGVEFTNNYEFPVLRPTQQMPLSVVPYSFAMTKRCTNYGAYVHFFEDDYRFESIWHEPRRRIEKLKKFAGIIEPEFSICLDYPTPLKIWNRYRSQLIAYTAAQEGISVIPTCRYQPGCPWLLEGTPKNSVIAIDGYGLVKIPAERNRFVRDVKTTIDAIEPTGIVYYGADSHGVLDYPRSLGIPIRVFWPERFVNKWPVVDKR